MITKKKLRDNRLMLSLSDDQANYVKAAAEASDLPEASWVRMLINQAMQTELKRQEQQIAMMRRQMANAQA
jgi:hypothetical protein